MNYIVFIGPYGGDLYVDVRSIQAFYKDRQAGTWLVISGKSLFTQTAFDVVATRILDAHHVAKGEP